MLQPLAQVQSPAPTEVARAAHNLRVNHHIIAHLQLACVVQRQAHNLGDDFVPQRHRAVVPVVVPARFEVQVCAAQPAGVNAQQRLVRLGRRHGNLLPAQRVRRDEAVRPHRLRSGSAR
jgi:hypothetical protein